MWRKRADVITIEQDCGPQWGGRNRLLAAIALSYHNQMVQGV